jgi:hypothetical protein
MWVDAPITRTTTMHGLPLPPLAASAPPPALPPPPPRGVPTGWLVAAGAGVVFLALLLLFRGGNPNDEALGLYTEARTRCEAGQFDACTAVLERAAPLARDPTTQRLIEELAVEARLAPQTVAGTAALEAGRLDDASRALEAARALAPDNPRVTKLATRLAAARAAEVPAAAEPPVVALVAVPPSDAPLPETPATPPPAGAFVVTPTAPATPPEAPVSRPARPTVARRPSPGTGPTNPSTSPSAAAPGDPARPAAATVAAAPASAASAPAETPRPRAAISLLNPAAGAPASAASDVGFLSVTSAVPGIVHVDGVSTGKGTPLFMFKVAPGEHAVDVRDASGQVVGRRSVRVEARGVVPVVFAAPK